MLSLPTGELLQASAIRKYLDDMHPLISSIWATVNRLYHPRSTTGSLKYIGIPIPQRNSTLQDIGIPPFPLSHARPQPPINLAFAHTHKQDDRDASHWIRHATDLFHTRPSGTDASIHSRTGIEHPTGSNWDILRYRNAPTNEHPPTIRRALFPSSI
jgi:hypothetical protein